MLCPEQERASVAPSSGSHRGGGLSIPSSARKKPQSMGRGQRRAPGVENRPRIASTQAEVEALLLDLGDMLDEEVKFLLQCIHVVKT